MTVDVHDAASPVPGLGQLLLDAKFTVPQPRPGSVSRAGLVKAARSTKCILVAVTAPAGYGKSTFLAEWARAEDRRVAWVSLDHFDDDPAMLLVSLASACWRAGLSGTDLIADVRGLGVSVLGRATPRLASALRASPHPFVIMLDDLHELQSTACDDVLSVVIAAIPPGSALVTASRSEQPHLPRLRASGEALEFGAGDLGLDAAGAQRIFADAQVTITRRQAAAVTEQTEGWPAGLHLAALIARQSGCEAQTVSGDDRYVADYLYRETLIRQPEDTQRFLRRTAVLDQLCVSLCDAVLGSAGAARQLRHLEAASLFVIPLDRRREWYRYHALFREFLLGELRRTEPDIIMTLHRQAADWYETSGSPALALEHLLQTTDWDRSMRLATALSLPTYNAGRSSTVRRWYRAIGDDNIERYPPLAVLRCWEVALTGDTAQEARWAFAEAARLAVHRGDLPEARRQLAQAMRSRPSATYLLPCPSVLLRLQLAKVCLAIAEVVSARQLLREIDDILRYRPALGTLTEEVEELRRALVSSDGVGATGRKPLTPAELRLLPYLQTHLTAGGIAERLFVSGHTVKAEIKSIYRKLGVSSRDEAVQKATSIGLLGG